MPSFIESQFPFARLSAAFAPPEKSPCANGGFGYLSTIRPLKVGLPVYPGQIPKSWGFLFIRGAR